jgi:hypothetical protein
VCARGFVRSFEARLEESMWDAARFRAWLDAHGRAGAWEGKIAPRLRDIAVWAIASAQDVLTNRKAPPRPRVSGRGH